jgi:hypothetical protein
MTDKKSIYQDAELFKEIKLKAKVDSGIELGDDDVFMCMMTMEKRRLSYFHGHIWPNKRWDKNIGAERIVWTPTAEGRRAMAHQHGLAGMSPVEFEVGEDGLPIVARVNVTKRYVYANGTQIQFDTYHGEARYAEFVERKRNGEIQDQWKRRPFNQLAKCAEMQALRRAFPEMELEEPEIILLDDAGDDLSPEPPAPEPEVKAEPVTVEASSKDDLDKLDAGAPDPEPVDDEMIEKVKEIIEGLKKEATPMFKKWAERYNDGKGLPWHEVYGRLTGIVYSSTGDMKPEDFKALMEAFKESLEKPVE